MTKKIVPPIVRVRTGTGPAGDKGRIMTADDVVLTPRQWLRMLRTARKLGIAVPYRRVKA